MTLYDHTMRTPACFLNVDLDVRAKRNLGPLREGLGETVGILFDGKKSKREFTLLVELRGEARSPELVLRRFIRLIRGLSGPAAMAWRGAAHRRFDIGIEGGVIGTGTLELGVSAKTMKALADIGAELLITVYPPTPSRADRGRRARLQAQG